MVESMRNQRNQREKRAVQVQKDNSKGYTVNVFFYFLVRAFVAVRIQENRSTAELEIPNQCNLYLSTGCYILADVLIFKGPKKPSCNSKSYFTRFIIWTHQAPAQRTSGQEELFC